MVTKKMSVALVGVICLFIFNTANAEELKIGIDTNYPPFSMIKDGEMTGFDIEIAKSLCEAMNVECKLMNVDWDDLIDSLNDNKIDAIISSMADSSERLDKVTFSPKYYRTVIRMVKPINDSLSFTARDLKGKRIGLIKGTIADTHITKIFGGIAKIVHYENDEKMFAGMLKKDVDLMLEDHLVLQSAFLDTQSGEDYHFFGPNLTDPTYYGTGAAVAVKLGNKELANKFAQAIIDIRKSGKYQEISKKYFNEDIY